MYIIPFDSKIKDININLVGGKGASLIKMTQLGLPVPPGFTITTKVWKLFDKKGFISNSIINKIFDSVSGLEGLLGRKFGSKENPLLLSVRSGAKHSMPGMMSTILDVGINEKILPGLEKMLGKRDYAEDTYKRFIKTYASAVFGIHIGEFDFISQTVDSYREFVYKRTRKKISSDVKTQLLEAIYAVFSSWYNPSAISYRRINGIPDDLGTAVNVQVMVFGNKENSGTGVIFTRDTQTGEKRFTGDYLEKAQGEDIVRGASSRRTMRIENLAQKYPFLAKRLFDYAGRLEKYYTDVQDIEFTVENRKIWLLQSRSAKRSPQANIKITSDLLEEGLIIEEVAFRRVKPGEIENINLPVFNKIQEEKALILGQGIPASFGVASGVASFGKEEVDKYLARKKRAILVGDHIDPNDVATVMKVEGVVTSKGSASSHMALIMRSAGKPGVVGCSGVDKINSGQKISINASLGKVYKGLLARLTSRPKIPREITNFVSKRNKILGKSPWSAGLYLEVDVSELDKLRETIKDEFLKTSKWRSSKAKTIQIVNKLFPTEEIIRNKLFKSDDLMGIKNELKVVLKDGYYNAPRTCHFPEKLVGAPWADGPNTEKDIEDFLTNPNFPGKYGGYPLWKEDPALEAIIVSHEPKGKLDVKLGSKHFVCTISCLANNPATVIVNVNFGTAQLRSLERIEATNLVVIKAILNQKADWEIGNIVYQIGQEHFDQLKIRKLFRALKNKKLMDKIRGEAKIKSTARHLAKVITLINGPLNIGKLKENQFRNLLNELMKADVLPEDVFGQIINENILSLVAQISKIIFVKWWRPPFALPYKMAALDEESGLSVLEAQGRFEKDKLIWFKIYGAKGAEEKEKIKYWQEKESS